MMDSIRMNINIKDRFKEKDRFKDYKFTFKDRFLKYVKYDTQSQMDSKTNPSTEKQNILLKELCSELNALKIKASFDPKGYVYARIPSNVGNVGNVGKAGKKIPAIGLLSHVDTNFDVSGKDVKPIIHKNYDGKDIRLPMDNQVIRVKENPGLKKVVGHDIITSDGSTLLGADDKAGVSEVMDAAEYIMSHPGFKHGDIMIAFTTDEEVGRGTANFDVKRFGADFAYTIDGENIGEVECETFNADRVTVRIYGHNCHTGYAKGKMVNAVRIAAEIAESFPKDRLTPETTSDRQGFIHVNNIDGNVESATIEILLRDYEEKNLAAYERMIRSNVDKALKRYPKARSEIIKEKQYRNMKAIIDKHPEIMSNAIKAMKTLGIKPETRSIRGGTDGCNLSYMGLPTPNIFCGEHNFHSKTEWASVQEMELSVRMIIELISVWAEEG